MNSMFVWTFDDVVTAICLAILLFGGLVFGIMFLVNDLIILFSKWRNKSEKENDT